ncbi:MAG: proton-conducting transporter membrane subunit, partial [Promethearchaeota archaeon]
HETGVRDLNHLGGLLEAMPRTGYLMLVGSLSIAGIPFFNGFISKWMIYLVCIAAGRPLLAFVAIFTSALTFAVFLRLLSSVFLGTKPEAFKEVHGAPKSMVGPSVVLAIACIGFGVLPQLAFILLLYPATLALLPAAATALPWNPTTLGSIFPLNLAISGGLWDPFLLVTILLVGLVIGYVIYRARGGFKEVPVTDKYLPFTGGALQDPYLKVDEARPTSTVFEHPLRPLLNRLRRLHTGLANMYVLWIVLFAITLLAILFVGTIWFGGWI